MANLKLWRSEELQRLKEESDMLFDRLCTSFGLPSVCRPLLEQAMHIYDTPEAVVVEATLPGVSAEDLDITISGAMLVVRCAHAGSCSPDGTSSTLESRFSLPCKVRTDDVEAELDNDVLRITMPKCRRPEARRIPVKPRAAS
ncbi:Hsp20/alpha crystallin family protein [Nitratidesulfovibrio vulgaris]|jgi:HSP20 family protein|nr:Hsp20/alpha crystallin family protein [Nitratidesulfovibrio vulgaris]GEB79203.1 HSP20 family protein [Desulfovibrio desulfuricans]HBW15902.1 Hsp20/alpha crystallin family protein [Desulfovibrio sp.]ABM28625.1 heat shock protein Hsp20 [Nitratidesulfovibrio vulgaris DP4]ADP86971.1 heat shock protein Hsp20 [Nitratidesulfovibrio vulgaris RCH1]WCB45022.1 Hsp20/alpha crystallin family protein [Nitratidesulfovibrio vulgaris]